LIITSQKRWQMNEPRGQRVKGGSEVENPANGAAICTTLGYPFPLPLHWAAVFVNEQSDRHDDIAMLSVVMG